MISDKKIVCPNNLLSLAKNKRPQKAAIISAGNTLAMESAYEATNSSLIEPIFIGDKEKIQNEAKILKWDISNFEIIDEKIDNNTAIHGAKIASEGINFFIFSSPFSSKSTKCLVFPVRMYQ